MISDNKQALIQIAKSVIDKINFTDIFYGEVKCGIETEYQAELPNHSPEIFRIMMYKGDLFFTVYITHQLVIEMEVEKGYGQNFTELHTEDNVTPDRINEIIQKFKNN